MAQIVNSLLKNSDLNLKKEGKTTRPFRYSLNQSSYGYTLEVTNSKGIRSDRVPEELRTEVRNIV